MAYDRFKRQLQILHGITTSTPVLDETPPQVTSNTLTAQTATSATFHVVTTELLKKIRIRYRIVGTTTWTEIVIIPTALAFDVSLTNLLAGQLYEYQYVLDDKSDNQSITEWVGV